MACAPGRGITAWASPGIAGGFCCAGERLGRRRTTLTSGPGGAARRGRRVRLCGRCGLVERRASGPARDGPCGAGPSRRWWAERESGAVGPGWARGKRKREGRWAGERLGRAEGLGWCFGFLGSFSISFSFLFLIQTKFEFKPHSNKSMHQHECNTEFLKLRQILITCETNLN